MRRTEYIDDTLTRSMVRRMKSLDKTLYKLSDELLVYVQQRSYSILEHRARKLNEEVEGDLDNIWQER